MSDKSKLENALLEEVTKSSGGLEATDLRGRLQEQGFALNEVQAALRRGLESGKILLGEGLKFKVHQ